MNPGKDCIISKPVQVGPLRDISSVRPVTTEFLGLLIVPSQEIATCRIQRDDKYNDMCRCLVLHGDRKSSYFLDTHDYSTNVDKYVNGRLPLA